MAKIYGINGVITGKLGAAVYAVRKGEQISRQYQPVVANPSTQGQVAARAKLKLMSQLSAVMAPVIAIPRQGTISSRNLFTKINYGSAAYNNNAADINLEAIKLTKSVVSLPNLSATRDASKLNVSVSGSVGLNVSRVVYAMFVKQSDNTLRYAGSNVISEAGEYNSYPASFTLNSGNDECVVYAYGVRDNTETAMVRFGDMQTPSAEQVAKLIVTRTLTENDVTLTETKCIISSPSL